MALSILVRNANGNVFVKIYILRFIFFILFAHVPLLLVNFPGFVAILPFVPNNL